MTRDRSGAWSLSEVVADQVSHRRRAAGLNRDQLAKACRDRGAPDTFTASAVANIETGRKVEGRRRRDVTIEELALLGAALKVPPALLVFPLGGLDDLEVLPGRWVDAWIGYQWFVGSGSLADLTGEDADQEALPARDNPVAIYRQHEAALRGYVLHSSFREDDNAEQARERQRLADRLAGTRVRMYQQGWRLPPLPAPVLDAVRAPLRGWGYKQDEQGGMTELPHPYREVWEDDLNHAGAPTFLPDSAAKEERP
jgi:transcriptional regulator with XRE-family HTH domain